MKPAQTALAPVPARNTKGTMLFSYVYTFLSTPFILSRFGFDILLCLLPWTRPTREWSLQQAVRMRIVRLVLLYWSLLRWGDRLSLRPGRERNRFEVLPPQDPKLYQGALADATIQPTSIGTTWTPARPPPPALVRPDLVVALHFHGGGFAIGTGRDADTGFTAQTLLRHLGCTHVCTPQYRLASARDGSGRFPAAVQDALTAYVALVRGRGVPPRQVVLSGDSAGATVALALLRYLGEHGAELGLPPPAAVALWSPWVDVGAALRLDMRASPNYKTDYLNREFGRWGAAAVAGVDGVEGQVDSVELNGGYLAPLHHPFTVSDEGMPAPPPLFVQGGDREVLWDDIVLLERRYREAGWTTHLHASPHCPHDILLLGPKIGFAAETEEAARAARKFFLSTTDIKLRGSG